jgi:hypothetical protein
MRVSTRICIDDASATPHGTKMLNLFDPLRGKVLGHDQLADSSGGRQLQPPARGSAGL